MQLHKTPAMQIRTAMVFAAGLGTRLRPLTEKTPKPLIKVHNKPLIDYALDKLVESGVQHVVVNTHYLAEQIHQHLAKTSFAIPDLSISHETPDILETGGGIVNALPLLGNEPFFTINSDVIWIDRQIPALQRLASAWNPMLMDALLLLHPTEEGLGYNGHGDFDLSAEGQIIKSDKASHPYVFAGVMIVKPQLFEGLEAHPFSIFRDFLFKSHLKEDGALDKVYGLIHDGDWLHIGCSEGLKQAELYFSREYQLNS